MITVIIGVLFLAAIGTIILTVTSRYLIAVNVDHNSSGNFYQTEGILEEVRTGLLEYAGTSGETAYKEVLENYSSTKSNMRKEFTKKFMSELAGKLTGYAYNWDDDMVGKLQNCDIDYVRKLTKVPDVENVVKSKGGNLKFIINEDTNGYSLTIKDLLIDYTDETDYRSTIETDICMSVPDYKFEGDSTLEAAKDYIVISDGGLKVSDNDNSKGASFWGNIYTGNRDSGINIVSNNAAYFHSPTIISRGSLDIFGGSHVKLEGETGAGDLWLQNIRLKPQGGDKESFLPTTLDLNANAYIANDLNIEANESEVTLSGKYYGYSYNEENMVSSNEDNTATPLPVRSDYSSAILINGMNTKLKAKNLDKLILAGRTFVSRKVEGVQVSDIMTDDIMMGESVAVKSNQLAYLLPEKYIALKKGAEGHNPLVGEEVIDESATKVRLLNSEIKEYLNPNKPFTANYNNVAGYVFYYLNFKDEKSANDYFKAYYEGSEKDVDGELISHKEQLDDRAKAYISTKDNTNMSFAPELFLVAGNVIHNYYASGGSSIQSANYFNGVKPDRELLTDGRKLGQEYVGYQTTLQASGSTGSMRLSKDAKELVAGELIDFTKLKSTLRKQDDATGGYIYAAAAEETCILDGSIDKGIIIADGDVVVKSNFEGLILATGEVKTTGSDINLKSDMVLVGKLLEFAKGDKELSELFRGMNGGNLDNPTTALSKCFSYQNWQKNSY